MATPQEIREQYYKARTYNWFSIGFGVMGLGVFGMMFQRYVVPRPLDALQDPSTLMVFLFPFVPAVVMSFIARRADKRFRAMMDAAASSGEPGAADKPS